MDKKIGFRFVTVMSAVVAISFGIASPSFSGGLASGPSSRFSAFQTFDLDVSQRESNRLINEIYGYSQGSSLSDLRRAQLVALIRSYRFNPTRAGSTQMSIQRAPYADALVLNAMKDIYASLYESQKRKSYEDEVVNISLETLFDGFMTAVRDGSLPASLQELGDQIGSCIARRTQESSCKLDSGPEFVSVSKVKLGWARFTCGLFMGDCGVRRLFFNAAKKDLIEARTKPEVIEMVGKEFERLFPVKFHEAFLTQLNEKRATVPEIVSLKFGGTLNSRLWDPSVALVPADEQGKISLKGFAESVRADLAMAEVTLSAGESPDSDPEMMEWRDLTGPLFFAAANKILVLSGGKAADYRTGHYREIRNFLRPLIAKEPPYLASYLFGGWGISNHEDGPSFSPWDWADYDPNRKEKPSTARLFPSEFLISEEGVPKYYSENSRIENLSDLAELIEAISEFMRVTRPDAAFGKFFGTREQMVDMADVEKPILFPMDARMLGIGVLGGIVGNLTAPGWGHLEQTAVAPGAGLGLKFHDAIGLEGRIQANAPLASVGRFLLAISHLRMALPGDPAVKPELLAAMINQIDSVLQVGALTVAAQAQEVSDGGFREKLGEPMTSARRFSDSIAGMRALTGAYSLSGIPVLRLNLKAGWSFLDKLWGERVIPVAIEGNVGAAHEASELWEALNLWKETQTKVREGLGDEVPWQMWEARMEALRAHLEHQLETSEGPGRIFPET